MNRGTFRRIWWAICAATNSIKWSWKVSSPDYSPEREDEEKRQAREAERMRVMRPLHEMELRKALRGPYAPKEITPEA